MEDFKITAEEWSIYHKMSSRYHKILEELNKKFPSANNIQSALIILLIHEGYPLIGDIEELQESVKEINKDLYETDIKDRLIRLSYLYGTTHAQPVNLGDTDAILKLKKEHDLMKAALLIMDNCKGKKKCEDCVFYRKDKPFSLQCGVENNVPSNWVLEKEVKDNV